jgi:HD-GYP domain-containing protein (c-di-GMP phosphodiesterase class II)
MSNDQEKRKIYLEYRGLIKRMEDVFSKIALDQFIVNDPFSSIIQKIDAEGPLFLEFIAGSPGQEQGLAKNAVDTAVLSACIARTMNLTDFTIHTLLVGSLLHDVGMLCIPQKIRIAKDLVKAQQQCILAHPIHGYKVIVKEINYHPEIGLVALQHHEYWDGTGYPQGLSGTNVRLTSRIVCIGDAFAAMTSPRPYRAAMTAHQAMNHLMETMTSRFDPDIFKVFVSLMGRYPAGSLVRLNNGAIARVIEQTDEPLKPRIRMLTEASGESCSEETEVSLREEQGLGITGEAEGALDIGGGLW